MTLLEMFLIFGVDNSSSSHADNRKNSFIVKIFTIPSWISKLKEPNIPFNLSLSSYQEITRIIKGMKFSGSLCPLDQISIICFKRCPYLRSFILSICTEVLRSNTLPAQWTKADTILIHKKGDPSLPENFVISSKQNIYVFN